jgi:hypothetical protein
MEVAQVNVEGRMQNAEYRTAAGHGMPFSAILHSSFCFLHSWGGPGAVWYWSGGGLTLIAQSSDIERLTMLAIIPPRP